jgi:beta-lactamase class A
MRSRMTRLIPFVALIGLVLAPLAAAKGESPADPAIDRLGRMVGDILKSADGSFGVAVEHLESRSGFSVNGDSLFPMASVVKLPILTEVMFEIGAGKFGLADVWEVMPSDQFYDGSLLSELKAPGIRLSVANLINLMMWQSDNTATDLLLKKVGIGAVNDRMRAVGIEHIAVGRTIREILLEYYAGESAPFLKMRPEEFKAVVEKRTADNPEAAARTRRIFGQNPRDHASPRAVNALLGKIFRREILRPAACEHILEVMSGCQTGLKRIRGLLPPETVVAHKTGTIGGTLNDCGIIGLPDGLGHVALSVLSRDADPDHAEEVIALVAKSVYDAFCFARSKPSAPSQAGKSS